MGPWKALECIFKITKTHRSGDCVCGVSVLRRVKETWSPPCHRGNAGIVKVDGDEAKARRKGKSRKSK